MNNTYLFACERDTPTPFSNKIMVFQHKKYQNAFHEPENHNNNKQKNTCVKVHKCPMMHALIFILFKGKIIFLLYFKVKRKKKPMFNYSCFLTSGVNKYLDYFNVFEKTKISLSNNSRNC